VPKDDKVADGDADKTVPLSEHKSLQRKLARSQTSVKQLEERIETLGSGQGRTETLAEGILQILGSSADDETKRAADVLLQGNAGRRTADTTAAQDTARLNALVEDGDVDWDDERYNSARDVYSEIAKSGDMARIPELERIIREVAHPTDASLQEQIDEGVRKALDEMKLGGARVDLKATSAKTGTKLSPADLGEMHPSEGIEGMRAKVNQALDQIGPSKR
jgi:hypothetical protein